MRILFEALGCGEGDNMGGSTRVAALHARGLVNAGHEVTFVCTNRLDKNRKMHPGFHRERRDGMEVMFFDTAVLPFWPGAFGPHYVRLNQSWREAVAGAEVVHLHGCSAMLAAACGREALRLNIPVIAQPQGVLHRPNGHAWLRPTFRWLYREGNLMHRAILIAATVAERSKFLQLGYKAERIRIIPNGFDSKRLGPLPARGGFRRRHGIPPEAKLIATVGRVFPPTKGQDLAIRALAGLPEKDHYLALVGPDVGFGTELRRLAAQLGVGPRVIFTGALASAHEVREAVVDSDVYLQPSRTEAFGIAIIEAAAAGKAMVLSTGCDNAPALANRCALVAETDPPALAQALRRLLEDTGLRARFEVAGPRIVREEYDITAVVEQLEQLYHEVGAGKASPASVAVPSSATRVR